MMKTMIAGLGIAVLGATANAQLGLRMIQSVDVSGAGIGNNPASVTWNGTDAYVGGFNNTGGAANVGIARISDVLGSASIGAA